jgi:hypothetical protein
VTKTRRHAIGFAAVTLAFGGACAAACSEDEAPPTYTRDAAPPEGRDAAKDDADYDATMVDSSGPFCTKIDASAVVFCGDFESNDAPLFGFDQSIFGGDGGAAFSVSDEGGINHPSFVLDVSLSQTASDAGREGGEAVFLTKDLTVTGKGPNTFERHELELDFRVVGSASLAYAALSVLSFPSALIKEHGFSVYDGNVFGRLAPKDFAVRDDESLWHHSRIQVSRPAGGSTSSFTVRIDIDGTLVDNVGGVDPGSTATSLIKVGGFATSASAGGSLRAQFDNVVVRRW